MIKKFYVYVYLDPRKPGEFIYDKYVFDYEPIYVGKGIRDRYLVGDSHNHNPFLMNKIRKIIREGFIVKVEFLVINLTEEGSFEEEREAIKCIGRYNKQKGPLCNLTDGGEGICGQIITEAYKNKTSKALKGRKGKPHTKETKKKLSIINTGKKQSPELIAKRVAGRAGYRHSEESKKKTSRSLMGHPPCIGNTGHKASKESIKRMSDSHIGKKQSKEQCRKKSESLKRAWKEGKFSNKRTKEQRA